MSLGFCWTSDTVRIGYDQHRRKDPSWLAGYFLGKLLYQSRNVYMHKSHENQLLLILIEHRTQLYNLNSSIKWPEFALLVYPHSKNNILAGSWFPSFSATSAPLLFSCWTMTFSILHLLWCVHFIISKQAQCGVYRSYLNMKGQKICFFSLKCQYFVTNYSTSLTTAKPFYLVYLKLL